MEVCWMEKNANHMYAVVLAVAVLILLMLHA